MKRIVMTGGGTSGHVTPNIALFDALKERGYDIQYIGSQSGIEKNIIENTGIPFHSISSGKLRRYLDLKNIADAFRVLKGFSDALRTVRKLKPNVVFSKGGYVSTPVVWAAFLCRVPVVVHESDYTPGLANKLSLPFASKICYTFPETERYLPKSKSVLTGVPVRSVLHTGSRAKGLELCGFDNSKPVIMIIGGSLGSKRINSVVRDALDVLLANFQICHICGKGGIEETLNSKKGYKQFEYVDKELPHFFSMADIVISRAGATAIFEILSLKKPNILIPLSDKVSRGDQILNAKSFEKQGYSCVLPDDELTSDILLKSINETYKNKDRFIKEMQNSNYGNSINKVIAVIDSTAIAAR
ncbi:MAG: undecaprenyldiphospho-muramoylpentapeptide beta-N-acetylglucosaminyltransferase [Bacillota bacterium]